MSGETQLFCIPPSKPLTLEQWWARAVWRPFVILPITSVVGLLFLVAPGFIFGFASAIGLPLYAPIAYWLVRNAKKRGWTYQQRWKILYRLTWGLPLLAGIGFTLFGAFTHRHPLSPQAWDTAYPIGLVVFAIGIILALIYLIYITNHTAKLRKENMLAFE